VIGGSGHPGVAFNNITSVIPGTFINSNISAVSTAAEFPRLIGGYSGASPLIDGQQEESPFPAINFGRSAGLCFYQAMEFNDVSGGSFPHHTMTINGSGSQGLTVQFQY